MSRQSVKFRTTILSPVCLALIVCMVSGCSASPYQPAGSTAPPTRAQLKRALEDLRTSAPENCGGLKVSYVMVQCTSEGLNMRIAGTPAPVISQASGGTNVFSFEARTTAGRLARLTWSGIAFSGGPKASAYQFGRAWAVLAGAGTPDPAKEAAFEQAAENYRAAAVTPQLPEAAVKYKVQAELAVQQKRFDDAVDLYDQALDAAPWWPAGHYNRGLILGELEDYLGGIRALQKYLKLEPAAANARAVQLKIYQWESLAPQAAN